MSTISDKDAALAAKWEVAKKRFEARLKDLGSMADWQDDLISRINRAQLKLELLDWESDEHLALAAEVADFRAICCALAGEGRDTT